MSTYFLVFDRDGPKVIAVQDSRLGAENAQLSAQQIRAHRYNTAREEAFEEGRSFGEIRTASDFIHEYYIQEATNL